MSNHPDTEADPYNLALFVDGPYYWTLMRLGLVRPPLDFVFRRAIFVALFAWLPLFVLAAINGTLLGDTHLSFLHDINSHVRFLVALPALILAELTVHDRLRPMIFEFLKRGIVSHRDKPKFDGFVASAIRSRNSIAAECILLALAYSLGHYLMIHHFSMHATIWYSPRPNETLTAVIARGWYFWISTPIFQFLLLRWYFRLFVWVRFLWRVSHLDLELIPTHPDRAGGLGFLAISATAFSLLVFAHGALAAGNIANHIFYDSLPLMQFKADIAIAGLIVLTLVLGPLTLFSPHLFRLRRLGLRQYGLLASQFVRGFDQKWVTAPKQGGEALMDVGDVQSLADLSNSYEVIRDVRPVPFGKELVIQMVLAFAAPILPLLLTQFPAEELVRRALAVFF